jgi:hypothetical protein
MLLTRKNVAVRPARAARRDVRAMSLLGNLFGGGSKPTSSTSNFHQLSALDIDKKNVDFKSLNNRVVLVVNVASK